ncbi:glycosyltransferase [Pseudaestuariivita rosea]|uniref:glycosyltransferase n=1 Tax=Pseudaestuariivita rosea TaxID=2763263 RepID=UPI001ABA5244|nr:glycosyltransferase [Pseudaestuariivita rosea]
MSEQIKPLVHIRTPTYKRPVALKRCLQSLIDQTWDHWVCDVYDDDPEQSAATVVQDLGDDRIRYTPNQPQKFASKNIDGCFSRANPHGAQYFCSVEDDNLILPRFIEDNIRICREYGVELVFRNQLIEHDSGTEKARFSDQGILEEKFREGVYDPDLFRLSILADIGVSNGGMFWSDNAKTDLEIGVNCTATLQEYMRTYAICEPIYVALEPLAVWAENGEQTTRDLGNAASYLRRELDLKRAIQKLQRKAWQRGGKPDPQHFISTDEFAFDPSLRATGLVKGLISFKTGPALGLRRKLELIARGLLIQVVGRTEPDLDRFILQRGD